MLPLKSNNILCMNAAVKADRHSCSCEESREPIDRRVHPHHKHNRPHNRSEIESKSAARRAVSSLAISVLNDIGGDADLFFSPLSIELALGMVYIGARSTTASEIAPLVGIAVNATNAKLRRQVEVGAQDVIQSVDQLGQHGVQLYVADASFVQKDFKVRITLLHNVETRT